MADFRKFNDLRIDLTGIYAYAISVSNKREAGWHDSIYFYPKASRREYVSVNFDSIKDIKLFEESVKLLDEYFSIKSDAEDKLLP